MSDVDVASGYSGTVEAGYERVREAFERNFTEHNEVGAAFAVRRNGAPIVDLWGGLADARTQRPWQRDTVSILNSGTKGMASMSLLLLFDRGLLDLDMPIAEVWPGFGAGYDDVVTIRHALTHTSGIAGLREPVDLEQVSDLDYMIERVSQEAPFWKPGTVVCYHAYTVGWLAAGLVKHLDGRSIGTFFDEEIAQPLGLDAWIAFPLQKMERFAPLHYDNWPASGPFTTAGRENPEFLEALMPIRRTRDEPAGARPPRDEPAMLAAEVPAGAGVADARSMAKLYDLLALGGVVDGRRFFSTDTAAAALSNSAPGIDWMSQKPRRWSFSFMLDFMRPRQELTVIDVGHPGSGGSLHGAWPHLGISFSYVMNDMRVGGDTRGQELLDALYESLREVDS